MTDLIWIGNTLYPRWEALVFAAAVLLSPAAAIVVVAFLVGFIRNKPRI